MRVSGLEQGRAGDFFTYGGNFFRENFLTAAPGKFLTAQPVFAILLGAVMNLPGARGKEIMTM